MGIVGQQMPQGAPQGRPQDMQDMGPGGDQATAEEQDWYNRAMIVVGKALYEKNAIKDLVTAVKSSPEPANTLAGAALDIVKAVDEKLEGNIPESMLASIAVDTMGQIVEGLQAAGVKVDGQMIAQATQGMLVKFLREQGVPEQELQKMVQSVDMNQVVGQVNAAMRQGEQEMPDESPEEPPGSEEPE
jgi:methylmalonyl-CoA mutase N-terminal domain/subunit